MPLRPDFWHSPAATGPAARGTWAGRKSVQVVRPRAQVQVQHGNCDGHVHELVRVEPIVKAARHPDALGLGFIIVEEVLRQAQHVHERAAKRGRLRIQV